MFPNGHVEHLLLSQQIGGTRTSMRASFDEKGPPRTNGCLKWQSLRFQSW